MNDMTKVKNYEIHEEKIFLPGHSACPGCAMALSLRYILNTMGPNTVGLIPPSCMGPIMGAQPYSSMLIPIFHNSFESSASSAAGIKRALKARGKDDVNVIALAGDGGTYDIGLQALSSVAEHNEDIIYFCMDNEGYMNTGTQKSSSTPRYAYTTSTPGGKKTKKKNIVEIMAAHRIPYVATATIGYLDDLVYKVKKAKEIKGTRFILLLIPCIEGWGFPENDVATMARLAVHTGVFPLYEVEEGEKYTINHGPQGLPIETYLSRQRRYRHLTKEQIAEIQEDVDHNWQRLKALSTLIFS
jgi:pyruvate ferredoxin oxidoreductase beta subunit/2-oxoisovalerate ferredoxin oxidoreductase beta subunit